jgi:GTP-binding protein Era
MASQARAPRSRPSGKQPADSPTKRAGTVALVGRPNVGKSTLLNALIGERLAITSHQPQTTRDQIRGILTTERAQFVFLDTPGIHEQRSKLGERMNQLAQGAAVDADVVLFVVDVPSNASTNIREDDTRVLRAIPEGQAVVLVVNKIDRITPKEKLFDVLAAFGALRDFSAVVPISAKKTDGLERLLGVIEQLLPEGPLLYPEDELSDRPVRFFVGELVREQVLLCTRQEVPHGVAVTVDAFEEPPLGKRGKPVTRVTLSIHVAKESHKGIIIGQGGAMLTRIGTRARQRAERLLGHAVHLDVRVRSTPGWFDDAARLAELGYGDDQAARPSRTRASRPSPSNKRRASPKPRTSIRSDE